MSTESKSIILAESSRLIGQIGNNIVLELYARVREVEALTRTLAITAENLPKSELEFKQLIPALIDFQGDLSIAGGGIWPEPYTFHPDRERYSFFWGRNISGNLEYYDDYNQSKSGYHHEAWYAIGRHVKPGQCVWSASYMDPHSYQPMVTCTASTFNNNKFSGVVTIDLKLEGLQAFIETWRKKTGGYIFVLDHNNRFITFPNPLLVRNIEKDGQQELIKEFIVAAEFATQQPLFSPLAAALNEMNQAILERARSTPSFAFEAAKNLSRDSHQISEAEAALMIATLTDPLNIDNSLSEGNSINYLYKNFEIENDFLLKEASTVFLFHIPRTYWKLVIVKPFSEAAMATYTIIQSEKMSSLGQLVAGVAHEVNNPINFIYGNLSHANSYVQDLLGLIWLYQQHYPKPPAAIQDYLQTIDAHFIATDLPKIITSMEVGADRIRQLVLSLQNFARMDEAEFKFVDLHEGLESTLLLLKNRLKSQKFESTEIQIIREYGKLPRVECYPGSLNQVFMNILMNAIDALEESFNLKPVSSERSRNRSTLNSQISTYIIPIIKIRTQVSNSNFVKISFFNNGPSIPEAIQQRLFDPFFTTKPVGKGIGLGLSICYQIITEKHQGEIGCISSPGQGAEFYIKIPLHQK